MPRDYLGAAAVEVDPANLRVLVGGHADVAGRSNIEIELVIRPDGQKLPTGGASLGRSS